MIVGLPPGNRNWSMCPLLLDLMSVIVVHMCETKAVFAVELCGPVLLASSEENSHEDIQERHLLFWYV